MSLFGSSEDKTRSENSANIAYGAAAFMGANAYANRQRANADDAHEQQWTEKWNGLVDRYKQLSAEYTALKVRYEQTVDMSHHNKAEAIGALSGQSLREYIILGLREKTGVSLTDEEADSMISDVVNRVDSEGHNVDSFMRKTLQKHGISEDHLDAANAGLLVGYIKKALTMD